MTPAGAAGGNLIDYIQVFISISYQYTHGTLILSMDRRIHYVHVVTTSLANAASCLMMKFQAFRNYHSRSPLPFDVIAGTGQFRRLETVLLSGIRMVYYNHAAQMAQSGVGYPKK